MIYGEFGCASRCDSVPDLITTKLLTARETSISELLWGVLTGKRGEARDFGYGMRGVP